MLGQPRHAGIKQKGSSVLTQLDAVICPMTPTIGQDSWVQAPEGDEGLKAVAATPTGSGKKKRFPGCFGNQLPFGEAAQGVTDGNLR